MSVPPSTTYPSSAPPAPPAGTEAAGHASTREAVLALLLREGESTAAAMAERLAVSVQVMRRHLRALELDGLAEATQAPAGPGRPINRWRLTAQGHAQFPDTSNHFALGLLQSMATSLPDETVRQLLRRQAIDKAVDYRRRIGNGSLRQRLERLVALRRAEGFLSELQQDQPADSSGQESWLISEFHCSVMRIAAQFPMVCDQELQLIRHTFPDCLVERIHWRLKEGHSCGFRLTSIAPPA